MTIKTVFQLSMILDSDKFREVYEQCCCCSDYPEEQDDELVDRSMEDSGVIVYYRPSQLKKRVRLTVDTAMLTGSPSPSPEKLVKKLDKLITNYFDSEYEIRDFVLSGMVLSLDINVGSAGRVHEYLQVLRRVGRVKGYIPIDHEELEGGDYFGLTGKSNSTNFFVYNLAEAMNEQCGWSGSGKLNLKSIAQEVEGILRVEVHLTKPRAIQRYTEQYLAEDQMVELSEKKSSIFMAILTRIVPFGDFHKKGTAAELIRESVKDDALKRRMLRLLSLVPEKKSLHLAQKSMSYRQPEKLLVEFAKIGLSPVTIGKRQTVKQLKNIYELIEI